jgi:hypothetical protein
LIVLAPLTAHNALVFKSVRLRALTDSPTAFGRTYANESLRTDADWIARAERSDGKRSILYLAMHEGVALGMAGSYLDENDATRAHLVSMSRRLRSTSDSVLREPATASLIPTIRRSSSTR